MSIVSELGKRLRNISGISGAPTSAGYPGSYFEWHTGLVSSFITHLVSLLAQGTFQKFPGLTFVLVEGGVSWIPPVLWRMDKNWKGLRKSVPLARAPPERSPTGTTNIRRTAPAPTLCASSIPD